MRIRSGWLFMLLMGACNSDSVNNTTPDGPDKPKPDAYEDPITMLNNEGGEIRLEWIQNAMGQNTVRVTAFFYKSEDPPWNPIPQFPGCFDMRAKDKWPLAQGNRVPLDVGAVAVKTSTQLITTNAFMNTADAFDRTHLLWYSKPNSFAANDGFKYPTNEYYDLYIQGSAEWPPQVYKAFAFMPAPFALISPPSGGVTPLLADTDFTWTFTPGNSTPPPGVTVNTVTAFKVTGVLGPVVVCQQEGTSGSMTVPKEMVNLLRSYGGATPATGTYVRQNLTHRLIELNDGSPRTPEQRKRIDVLTIYCYNSNWAAM